MAYEDLLAFSRERVRKLLDARPDLKGQSHAAEVLRILNDDTNEARSRLGCLQRQEFARQTCVEMVET